MWMRRHARTASLRRRSTAGPCFHFLPGGCACRAGTRASATAGRSERGLTRPPLHETLELHPALPSWGHWALQSERERGRETNNKNNTYKYNHKERERERAKRPGFGWGLAPAARLGSPGGTTFFSHSRRSWNKVTSEQLCVTRKNKRLESVGPWGPGSGAQRARRDRCSL